MQNTRQIVVFTLQNVQYGFPIEEVNEIIRYISPTPIPNAPFYLEGVISLRGRIHSVFDLRSLLGMDKKKIDNNTKIIITNDNTAGFIVDDVKMIVNPKEEEIDTNINLPIYFDNNYVEYILKIDGNVIFVLNMLNILNAGKEAKKVV